MVSAVDFCSSPSGTTPGSNALIAGSRTNAPHPSTATAPKISGTLSRPETPRPAPPPPRPGHSGRSGHPPRSRYLFAAWPPKNAITATARNCASLTRPRLKRTMRDRINLPTFHHRGASDKPKLDRPLAMKNWRNGLWREHRPRLGGGNPNGARCHARGYARAYHVITS